MRCPLCRSGSMNESAGFFATGAVTYAACCSVISTAKTDTALLLRYRPLRAATANGPAILHRSQSRSGRHTPLVRPSLVHRGDLCRGPPSSRCRDPTPVVPPGHRTHNARPARAVLVTPWAHKLYASQPTTSRAAAWHPKPLPTFSDALAVVRRELWIRPGFDTSAYGPRVIEIPRATISALIRGACYAA
jgi:hypothetical protein